MCKLGDGFRINKKRNHWGLNKDYREKIGR
jgi:hypothetical protein